MNNRRFVTYMVSIPVVAGLLLALVADASAAPMTESGWHPSASTAMGNPPSAARAQMARYNVPGGCVVTYAVDATTGILTRHSRCEYSPAVLARLASTGR